jgi:hypothetical protein
VEPRIRAAESTHWYTREGVPMYTVEAKKWQPAPYNPARCPRIGSRTLGNDRLKCRRKAWS